MKLCDLCGKSHMPPHEGMPQCDPRDVAARTVNEAIRGLIQQRDDALAAVRDVQRAHDRTRALVASLLVIRDAAKEYLMRSVCEPNSKNAEETLREALADLEMAELEKHL